MSRWLSRAAEWLRGGAPPLTPEQARQTRDPRFAEVLRRMPECYILDRHGNPVLCTDPMRFVVWRSANDVVLESTNVGPVRVSTVFLCHDTKSPDRPGPPILWETMFFVTGDSALADELSDRQVRYTSQAEARIGHRMAVEMLEIRFEAVAERATVPQVVAEEERTRSIDLNPSPPLEPEP